MSLFFIRKAAVYRDRWQLREWPWAKSRNGRAYRHVLAAVCRCPLLPKCVWRDSLPSRPMFRRTRQSGLNPSIRQCWVGEPRRHLPSNQSRQLQSERIYLRLCFLPNSWQDWCVGRVYACQKANRCSRLRYRLSKGIWKYSVATACRSVSGRRKLSIRKPKYWS